ncbi:MAG: energy-coupling factor ABC transporter ATP-binding protein [Propionibacteriaceae bacterium]|nr:energy-coupling factor ABC transporter ATP-binding protein [Propionibacteriaceae bacterium]
MTVAVETPAGPKTLLDDLGLELGERRVVVLGANGSGKSTLLRLINGLVRPSAGRAEVDGWPTTGKGSNRVRRRVGFVFTDPMAQLLMPTVGEDVELSLRQVEPDRKRRRARAEALLEQWGLGHLALSSVYDLSAGERQLVALLSVLAARPDIVVADEPTTLLDRRQSRRLRARLAALEQQLIVATHDLEWALDFDRALVVEAGRLVFDGPPVAAVDYYRALVDEPTDDPPVRAVPRTGDGQSLGPAAAGPLASPGRGDVGERVSGSSADGPVGDPPLPMATTCPPGRLPAARPGPAEPRRPPAHDPEERM